MVFDIFGPITNPLEKYGSVVPEPGKTGLVGLLNNILRLVFIVAGLFAMIQVILAGFDFISAGGNPESVSKAWSKIWQALVGLMIVVISFLAAMLMGQILFGNQWAILRPQLYGPDL